jgi:alpha-glucosidase
MQVLRPWSEAEGAEAWPSWAFSNHDAPRVASRWGGADAGTFAFGGGAEGGSAGSGPAGSGRGESARGASAGASAATWMALLLALRGTVFLYQGEELGLPQSRIAFEDLRDPFGLANWPLNAGRDGCRTPFPWQCGAAHGGFSRAQRTWLPADPAQAPLAVDRQLADPSSMLHLTRRLLALRRAHPALRLGDLHALVAEGEVLVLRRRHEAAGEREALLLAFNLGAAEATVPLPERAAAEAAGATPLFEHAGATLHDGRLGLPPGAVLYARLR